MSKSRPATSPVEKAHLRSGTAARLAALPVATLRVWERRYGVAAAARTESGQRIYSGHDVARLRLLRRLTQAGHPIGTIAALELEALQALYAGADGVAPDVPAVPRSAVVVGRSAAHMLESVAGWQSPVIHDDLDQAERATAANDAIDLLLVRLASLPPASVERVLALRASLRASSTVVLYAFGTAVSAESLRAAGVTVRREPVTSRELAQLVRESRGTPTLALAGWQIAPRHFSDEALAALAETPSPIACECLRHMAEIVALLAGFERYSHDCTSSSPGDAALHRHLSGMAGATRSWFEQALQRAVTNDGLVIPDR